MTQNKELIERDKLISAKVVQDMTGIRSRVTLWRKSNDEHDRFPRAFRDGTHYTRWKLSEVEAWINSLRQDEYSSND